jgi:hypothetical protein
MAWSDIWPVERWDVPDDVDVFGDLRAALLERDGLTPAGRIPSAYGRLDTIEGVPPSDQALGRMQYEIDGLLQTLNPWRWWDRARGQLSTRANLLGDAVGRDTWTVDLMQASSRWAAPRPLVFNELRQATNGLTCLRTLPVSAVSSRVDSVYELTFGISDWASDRAAVFALFDGADDGADTGLAYDVGLSAVVFDSGADQQWYVDARQVTVTFDTSALDGLTITGAWLELNTAACEGGADYSDTFTAEVVAPGGAVRGTFASDDTSLKSIALQVGDIDAAGDTVLTLRSQRANAADRAAWTPPGPDYSSTYREAFDLGDTLRLIVEVQFEYHA